MFSSVTFYPTGGSNKREDDSKENSSTPGVFIDIVGVSFSKSHSNIKYSTIVHARRTTVKNGIATHYYSLVQWFMSKLI